MILKVKEFQSACKSILEAVDTTVLSVVNEALELKLSDGVLYMHVTNNEYFASVKIPADTTEEFIAVTDAKKFLSLISKITTESLEITVADYSIVVKANGVYRFPMLCSNNTSSGLIELSPIEIYNKTSEFVISSEVLKSIVDYNSKELTKGVITRTVQKMFYLDEQGCITFTSGACVNAFTLQQPVKLLLSGKLVKLFKLFDSATEKDVKFTLGYDEENGVLQTKVRFENSNIVITSKLTSDESMLLSVPKDAIRQIANNEYAYSIEVERDTLVEAINRLMLFAENDKNNVKACGKFKFKNSRVEITDFDETSVEIVAYENPVSKLDNTEYECMLNLSDLKATLDCCHEKYLTMHFGDSRAVVFARGNIKNIISESHLV